MLDFYLIPDIQPTPGSPGSLEQAGELDSRTFGLLKEKKIIPPQYDYYTDFRWNNTLIQQLENTILMKPALQADTDVQQLLLLLRAAREKQSGLIAYAD
ncbi:hypothetical protein [Chitinophaga sp. OAE865]|uniref:hypothetical protein n=1 Tax=Chitinophaga sp. OAE865 TaxID=2817898 RepID=UPI001AE6AA73